MTAVQIKTVPERPPTVLVKVAAAKRGLMVALMLPPALARKIAIPEGEPVGNLHCTLCFPGSLDDLPVDAVARAIRATQKVAAEFSPVLGLIGGVGRFNASDSSDAKAVVHAMLDAPLLPPLREALAAALDEEKIPPKRDHGFDPHITLSYESADSKAELPDIPTQPVVFESVSVIAGDDRTDIPLTGARLFKGFPNETAEAGVHVHNLERENLKTKKDGRHNHIYVLPDGTKLLTDEDGAHQHPLPDEDANEIPSSGPHSHRVVMLDGTVLQTKEDGPHEHQLQAWSTAFDGTHVHELELPDGKTIRNLWPGEYWQHRGEPPQIGVPFAPPASQLARLMKSLTAKQQAEYETETQKIRDRSKTAEARKEHGFRVAVYTHPNGHPRCVICGDEERVGAKCAGGDAVQKRAHKPEYLESVLAVAQSYLPVWLWKQIHAAALPSSGGRARWKRAGLDVLEKIALTEIRPARLKGLDDQDLGGVWLRLHQWFRDAKRQRKPVKEFVNAAVFVIDEMESRGKKVGDTDLAQEARALSTSRKSPTRDKSQKSEVLPILCSDHEKRIIYAVPMEPDEHDTHGEFATRETIEKAAHDAMRNGLVVNLGHGKDIAAEVVESAIYQDGGKLDGHKIKPGSWVVAIHVSSDRYWAAAKRGEFGGVSIEGLSRRRTA